MISFKWIHQGDSGGGEMASFTKHIRLWQIWCCLLFLCFVFGKGFSLSLFLSPVWVGVCVCFFFFLFGNLANDCASNVSYKIVRNMSTLTPFNRACEQLWMIILTKIAIDATTLSFVQTYSIFQVEVEFITHANEMKICPERDVMFIH